MAHETGFASILDAAVLARAQRGDNGAFAAIYRCFERPAFGLALRILGRPAAAEDAVHDAFLRAFERLDSYRGDAPFGAWMKRLVANAAIDRLRSEQRWDGDDDEVALLDAGGPADADLAEAQGLLARLPARARSVVWLHEMEGYSHAEIAALFRQSESWSKSILARSLERLRRQLEDEEAR
jgi:RNA polymerase sigma-70 factor, ECF subfamily